MNLNLQVKHTLINTTQTVIQQLKIILQGVILKKHNIFISCVCK